MTSEDGRLTRQFRRLGRRASSTCAEEVLREAIVKESESVQREKNSGRLDSTLHQVGMPD